MPKMDQIHAFAVKWCDKFRDQTIHYIELVDHYMADDCEALGFVMDCGNAFAKRYGDAVSNVTALDKIIDEVKDISLLGSAIYSRWRYFNHWAYSAEEVLEPQNRTWFILALSRMAMLTGENPFIFSGQPKQLHIISNNIGLGPQSEPGSEVEQRMTITLDGQVFFSAYSFEVPPDQYRKTRTQTFRIEQTAAQKILGAVATYFSNEYDELFATDVGNWSMELTNTEGVVYKFGGALSAGFEVNGVNLSDLIRDALKMKDLYVFDGNPNRVDRVAVDYHRVTKIKPGGSVLSETEYVIWDYTEKLVVDRASSIIEHIQNIGTDCTVSRKFHIEEGVKNLLDALDSNVLFGAVEGKPDNVVDDPLETRDYTITVDFKHGPQRIIQGTYDKTSLPEHWGDFAESLLEFIQFYGFGEILNPAIYRKAKRRAQGYMYCSVEFESDGKRYHYISDDDTIKVGDRVVVPVGKDNYTSVGIVAEVGFYPEDEVPFPLEKTKYIIDKIIVPEADFDSDVD